MANPTWRTYVAVSARIFEFETSLVVRWRSFLIVMVIYSDMD